MVDVKFRCPHCAQPLEAPGDMAGQNIACPQCRKTIRVPAPPVPGPTPVPRPLAVAPPASANAVPQTSGLAVASMVLGILGLTLGWMCGGFILSLLAVVMGHVAFSAISRRPQTLSGKGLAIAGFTTGYVGLAIALLFALILQTMFAGCTALTEAITKGLPPPRLQ